MQDNTALAPQAAATCNVNLSTDPKRMAIIKVWDAILGQKDIRDCVPFLFNRDNVI
jgi:hypothetical protein